MKNIFFLLVFFTGLSYSTEAQKITFGVSAGISGANAFIKEKDTNNKWEKVEGLKSINSFTGSISANIPFSKYFSFQPGISYLQKGFKTETADNKTTLTLNYIEVPLTIMFKTNNKSNDKKADDFFFGIGPSVAFGVSGNVKFKTDSGVIKEEVKFGTGDNDIKGIDVGANAVLGCMFFNNFFFAVNYNIGLNNLSNAKEEVRWRNNYLAIKVGYTLGGNKK